MRIVPAFVMSDAEADIGPSGGSSSQYLVCYLMTVSARTALVNFRSTTSLSDTESAPWFIRF